MATEKNDLTSTRPVAADYSANHYHCADINSSRQWVLCSRLGQRVMGTLLDKPSAAGSQGQLRHGAIGKVVLGGTVSDGDPLVSDANAHAIKQTGISQHVFGRALEGGIVGDVRSYRHVNEGPSTTPEVQGLVSTVDPRIYETFGYGAGKGLATLQQDGAAYTVTALALNIMHLGSGNRIAAVPIVQEDIEPAMAATGLDIQGDQTSNDGFELISGILGTTGRPLIVGTDPAFYFQCTALIAGPDGTDDLHIGWRALETVNATYGSYDTFAGLGCNSAADPMALKVINNLNGAGAVVTDTGDTDAFGDAVTFRVNVSASGVCTFLVDGAAPSAVAPFTFDDGDFVVPHLHYLQATSAQTGAFVISEWIVDYQ